MLQLVSWLDTHGEAHGFTATEIADFNTKVTESQTALNAHIDALDIAHSATVNKNMVIGNAIGIAHKYVQKLQHNTTDEEQIAAGLSLPDKVTPAPSPYAVSELAPPLLLLDFSIRHEIIIHWGPNPSDEHQNTKPHGILGCEIQYAKEGTPQNDAGWTTLCLNTVSPELHHIPDTDPTTYVYRARYTDKRLNYGKFSTPAEGIVNG